MRRDPRIIRHPYSFVAPAQPTAQSVAASPRRTVPLRRPSLRYHLQMRLLHLACALISHPQQRIDDTSAWTICPCGERYYTP